MPGRGWLSKEDMESMKKILKTLSESKEVLANVGQSTMSQKDFVEIKQKLDLLIEENQKIKETLIKVAALISKMYDDEQINKDTFNRLDEMLHDYLDSSINIDEE